MIGKSVSHYRITEKLGAGGMGEVYRADDTNLDRQVAIKVLPDIFSGDPERLARFEREAKLLASLNHPNIATIHGLEKAEGKRFLVMELVEGETLAQRIAKGALPVDETLEICSQIAEGLEAAHEKGVIHRDLKPANIKITPEGKVKILDFGLAKALAGETQSVDSSQSPTITEGMTRPGVVLGTAAYMSPEQAKGKAVDKRADIWAFGCILFECLAGKRPFEGETITETLASILKGEPNWQVLPTTTPSAIRRLLRRCLTKDTKERFHDIADIRLEFEDVETAPELSQISIARKGLGRPVPLILAGLIAILGIVAGGVAVWRWHPTITPVQGVAHASIVFPKGDKYAGGSGAGLALSPDGSQLVYVGSHGGSQSQLFLRDLATLESKPIVGTDGAYTPFFSPDGAWIGFTAQGKLKKVSITGSLTQVLCDMPGDLGGSWGEDGTIVFSPGGISGLWKVSSSGGQPQHVTTLDPNKGEINHRWPQVLPGGKAILFTVWTGPGSDEKQVQLLVLQTGERRVLIKGGQTGRYAPSGHLVYARTGTLLAVPFDLSHLTVARESPTLLIENVKEGSEGANYAVSANGELAYVDGSPRYRMRRLLWVDRSGRSEVYVQPFPGLGERWQISTEGGVEPMWAKQGHELFYLDLSGTKMMSVPISTQPRFSAGSPKFLFEGNFVGSTWNPRYDVSPDGQRFLMVQSVEAEEIPTKIEIVLNWFEELKRLVPSGK